MFKRLIQSRWGTPIIAAILIIGIMAIQFTAMNTLSMYGVLPPITYAGGGPFLVQATFEPVVPQTGGQASQPADKMLFSDTFAEEETAWRALSGQAWREEGRLKIAPPLRDIPGLAEWSLTKDQLPAGFTYAADIWSMTDFRQTSGLALNLGTDSPLLFLFTPEKQVYAIGVWKGDTFSNLTEWEFSDCIQSGRHGNRVEIGCNGTLVTMKINACNDISVSIEQACSLGAAGAVVINPGWILHLDNAAIHAME